jgi:hypothetical protein
MTKCPVHTEFFDDSCNTCKQEYKEMKGTGEPVAQDKKYKEFTEERAKKLYEELMLQYLKSGANEIEADRKAKAIIRKQCSIRGMPFWSWA